MRFLRYFIVCVLVLDLGARLVFKLNPDLAAGDSWWRRGWVEQRRQGKMGLADYDPLKGWINRRNLKRAPHFFDKELSTNSVGARGTTEFKPIPSKDKRRILVVGDSFTFGSDVNDEETYAYYLEKSLPNVEVLNFGVPGYGQDQMLLYLRELVRTYRPHLVVLGFLELDMERNMLSFRDYEKPFFKIKNGELVQSRLVVSPPNKILRTEHLKRGVFDLFSTLFWQVYVRTGGYKTQMLTKTDLILKEMKRTVDGAEAKTVFFYLPNSEELLSEKETRGEKFLRGVSEKYQVIFGTARPSMNRIWKLGGKLGASTDGRAHYSPDGHRVVAGSLAEALAPLL